MFVTYVHTLQDLTPFYVGKGSVARAMCLRSAYRNKLHTAVVEAHGKENIIVEMIECRSEQEAFMREKMVISALRAAGVELCNLTNGGEGSSGFPCSDSVREFRRARMVGNTNTKGAKRSVDAVEKTRLAHVGRTRSAETVNKLRLAGIGRIKSSEERLKLSKSTSKKYVCSVCGHINNAPNMSQHFSKTGHIGSTPVIL